MKFTNEILLLRQYKSKAMSQCGPTRFGVFGVFGSVARGEQTDRNICLIFYSWLYYTYETNLLL